MNKSDQSILIRPAKLDDYGGVMGLYAEFVDDKDRFKNLDNDSYKDVLESPLSNIFLAETDEGRLVGFITFSYRFVVRYPNQIMEIEELFISPSHQRMGIGKRLMEVALDAARCKNCSFIFLASDKKRKTAHTFHQSLGFSEYGFHYKRKP